MKPSRRLAALLATPLAIVLLVGVVVPGMIFVVYSVFTFRLRQVHPGFTLDSFKAAITTAVYRTYAVNTLRIAIPVALITTVAGFALAHHIAFRAKRTKNLLLALVTISMLGSYLARVYAFRTLLGEHGVINETLISAGIINDPIGGLLFSRTAVVVAEVNLLLPLVTLLIYAGLMGIPRAMQDAGRDLGAGGFEVVRRVTLPMVGPAVLAALAFAFFLSVGDYVTPVLLGGKTSATIGIAISDQLRVTGNYALGSALSILTLLGFVLAYLLLRWSFRTAKLLPEVST